MTVLDIIPMRAARERLGLAQSEVFKTLGVAKGVCGEWERGTKTQSIDKLCEICEVLDSSADTLLGLAPAPAPFARVGRLIDRPPHERAGGTAVLPASADLVFADERLPHGLRQLADSRSHHLALGIAPHESATLASLNLADGLTRDGYVGLFMLLRAAAAQTHDAQPAAPARLGDDLPTEHGDHDHVSEGPATVHEPPRPKYPPR